MKYTKNTYKYCITVDFINNNVIMQSFNNLKSKSNKLFLKETYSFNFKPIYKMPPPPLGPRTRNEYIYYKCVNYTISVLSLSLSPVGDTAWLSWPSCSLSCSWGSWLTDERSSFCWMSWLSWWSCVCSRCSTSLFAASSLCKRAWNSQTLSCSVCTNTHKKPWRPAVNLTQPELWGKQQSRQEERGRYFWN